MTNDPNVMGWDDVLENDGQVRRVNDVDRFIDYDPSVEMTPVNEEELPW